METNRGKQVNISRGGSRSKSNLVFQMTTLETQMPPSPFEVYYKLHYSAKKQGWQSEHLKAEYVNMIAHKKAAMDKLKTEGTIVTTDMDHNLEKEAIKGVCGKQKMIDSGWQVGVGPVLRKKDRRMKSSTGSSRGAAESRETNENTKNQVDALNEQLKQSNDKCDRMSDFLLTKFPNFESSISKSVTKDAHNSGGLSGDSYSNT